MERMKLLFDASSLLYALKLRKIDMLCENYIQQLTVYEAINAIWKEAYLVKSLTPGDADRLIKVLVEVLDYLNILSPHPYEPDIFRRAVGLGLTVYDASYIVLAGKKGLTLVTEDRKLMENAGKIVNVISLRSLIRQG